MAPVILSVSQSARHTVSKDVVDAITLLAGLGVQGDAHAGASVRHRYRVRQDPSAPNLCQVHLLHAELYTELRDGGIALEPGQMGENVTTTGLDLLTLPVGALLQLGDEALVEITGLRDPCVQMNRLRPGLMKACLARDVHGALVRKAGVMAVVRRGGLVRAGDPLHTTLPPQPWQAMGPV